MNNDLGEAFEKLKSTMFIKYRGCLIEINATYCKWNNEVYSYLDNAKDAIDESYEMLEKSFNNKNRIYEH